MSPNAWGSAVGRPKYAPSFGHTSDLYAIVEQQQVILVYEEVAVQQISELTETLRLRSHKWRCCSAHQRKTSPLLML